MFYEPTFRNSAKLFNVIIFLCFFFILSTSRLSNAGIIVTGSLAQEHISVPGESYTGQIILKNPDDSDVEVKIYQTDYRFYSNGENYYDKPGTNKRSNAKWIKFSPQIFTMQSKSERTVYYTVTVPTEDQNIDIQLSGTFWSLLMIESMPLAEIEKNINKNQLGINSVMRYAMQIITHIGTNQNKNLNFSGSKLLKNKEGLLLQFDIENTGEQLLKPIVRLELYDKNGQQIGDYFAEKKRTFPATSVRYGIKLDKLKAGNYKALIIADCGADDLFGHQLTLDLK